MKLTTSPFVSHFPENIVTAITISVINSNITLSAPPDMDNEQSLIFHPTSGPKIQCPRPFLQNL